MKASDLIKVLEQYPEAEVAVSSQGQVRVFSAQNIYLHEYDGSVLLDIDDNAYKHSMTDGKCGVDTD